MVGAQLCKLRDASGLFVGYSLVPRLEVHLMWRWSCLLVEDGLLLLLLYFLASGSCMFAVVTLCRAASDTPADCRYVVIYWYRVG